MAHPHLREQMIKGFRSGRDRLRDGNGRASRRRLRTLRAFVWRGSGNIPGYVSRPPILSVEIPIREGVEILEQDEGVRPGAHGRGAGVPVAHIKSRVARADGVEFYPDGRKLVRRGAGDVLDVVVEKCRAVCGRKPEVREIS